MRAETIVWHKPEDKLPDDGNSSLVVVAYYEAGNWAYNEVLPASRRGNEWLDALWGEHIADRVIAWAHWPNGPRGEI